jgi:hypothetical protein
MPKVSWSDFLACCREPYLLVVSCPSAAQEQTLHNARAAQQLLERLLGKLALGGDYSVTVSRQDGPRQIVCAFREAGDANRAARVTKAREGSQHLEKHRFFSLNEAAERRLKKIAGPPAVRRTSRPAPYGLGRP